MRLAAPPRVHATSLVGRTHARVGAQQRAWCSTGSGASHQRCGGPRLSCAVALKARKSAFAHGALVGLGRGAAPRWQRSQRRLRCCAVLGPVTLASVLAVCGVESVVELAAFFLGSAMGAGSFVLYSPIILRLMRTRQARGMSVTTWALQLFAFTAACIYNAARGHSLSAWGETLVFSVQVRLVVYRIE